MVSRIFVSAWSLLFALGVSAAWADTVGPIDFNDDADCTNADPNPGGLFRDILGATRASRGLDLGGTGHTALNSTGSDNNSAYRGIITVYGSDPTDGLPTLWTGDIQLSTDVLIHPFHNAKGAGLLFLFNEGVGMEGLALYLWNAGNSDSYAMNFVHQDGVSRPGNTALSQSLGSNIPQDAWFRLTLDLVFSGSNYTETGKVFRHTTTTDPGSALGTQIGTSLVYAGVLSSAIANPYETGYVARGDSAVVDTSVTNLGAGGTLLNGGHGNGGNGTDPIPEPASALLLAGATGGVAWLRRRRKA